MRQVHEKWPVLVALDRRDRLVGEVVGQVLGGLEPLAGVVADAVAHVGPQEAVDRVEVLFGIDHSGVFFGQVQPALHEQALVEALVVGPHLGGAAEVPFADVDVVVAAALEQFSHRALGRWHAQVAEIFGLAGFGLVDDGRVEAVGIGVQRARDAGQRAGRGSELDAKAPGVAARHQCRARDGAHRAAGVALVEPHAVAGDRIDGRCGHAFGLVAAAVGRDIVDAQVVGHDHDDVGRALRQRLLWRGRPGLPGHRAVGLAGVGDVGVPAQRVHQHIHPVGIDQRSHSGERKCSDQQGFAKLHLRHGQRAAPTTENCAALSINHCCDSAASCWLG